MTAFSTALAPAHASPGSRCSQASQGASPSSSCWQQTNKGRRGRAGTLVPDSLLPRLVGSRQTKAGEAGRGRWCRTHTSPSGERRRVVHGDRKVEEGGGDEARARARAEVGGRKPKSQEAGPVFMELERHPRRRQQAEAACSSWGWVGRGGRGWREERGGNGRDRDKTESESSSTLLFFFHAWTGHVPVTHIMGHARTRALALSPNTRNIYPHALSLEKGRKSQCRKGLLPTRPSNPPPLTNTSHTHTLSLSAGGEGQKAR